jgi:ribonuclease-3
MINDHVLGLIQDQISVRFKNPQLLLQAITHKSYASEHKTDLHFEKLELLGDALLDFLVLEYLMQTYTSDTEGQLSKKRSSLVNQAILETIARDMKLSQFIRLGRSEAKSGGSEKASILSSVVEAILGAVYMDQGIEAARALVERWFSQRIFQHELFKLDFKTELQEKVQAKLRKTPTYREIDGAVKKYPSEFIVGVFIDEVLLAKGEGKSKKEAEQKAARRALEKFNHGV